MTEFRPGQMVKAKGVAYSRPMRVVGPADGEAGKLICQWAGDEFEKETGVFDADALERFQPTSIILLRSR